MSQNQKPTLALRSIATLEALLEEDAENLANVNRQNPQNLERNDESNKNNPCSILDRYLEKTDNESVKKFFYYQENALIYDPIELEVFSD